MSTAALAGLLIGRAAGVQRVVRRAASGPTGPGLLRQFTYEVVGR